MSLAAIHLDYFFISILGFAVGVLARSVATFGWAATGFIALFGILCAGVWTGSRVRWYAAGAVFFFAAALGAARTILAPQALPTVFQNDIGAQVSYDGVIVADPDVRDTNQHLTILTEKDGVQTKVLAYAPLYPAFQYGEHVAVYGMLEAPAPFDTESGRTFAYDHFLAKDDIFAIIPVAKVESAGAPSGLFTKALDGLYGVKHAFARGLENALPEPAAALAEGLLVGGKQGLGKSLLNAFTIAGLIQIVVLSGYNVMIIAEGVLRALSCLPRRLAAMLAGAGIIGFVIAAGSGSSAIRAGIMACLALYGRAASRTYDALRALALALLLMLIWNPFYLVYDPGFELSFMATLGLVIGTPITEKWFVRIGSSFLREIAATTVAAQIAVLPLLLWITGNLSLVAIPANILVMPVIPLAMALSGIAGLIGMLMPAIAPIFGIPGYLVLMYIIDVGTYAAKLPLAHATIPAFSIGFAVLAYALIYFVASSKRFSHTAQLTLSRKAST